MRPLPTSRHRRSRPSAGADPRDASIREGFERVAPFTVGVEEEYMLVDPETFEFAPVAEHALLLAGDDARLAPEFRASQIEAIAPPAATVAEVERSLVAARRRVAAALAGEAWLVACGTHPLAHDPGPVTARPRYQRLARSHPWAAAHVVTCGLHVHVAVSGADRALAVYNALRGYLPELVALGANAPFHHGEDTGLASVRPKLNQYWPRSGVPPAFASWHEVAELESWARDGGAYPDESFQWWDLRLRPVYGTLEVRAPDVQTRVEDSATIAAFVQALVYELASRYEAGETLPVASSERIQENLWLATRDGLAGRLIELESGRSVWTKDRLVALVERLLPWAAMLGCDRELLGVGRIAVDGGGAGSQRRLYDALGGTGLVAALAHESVGRESDGDAGDVAETLPAVPWSRR
jgi:carboxylate-amine ligase